MKNILLFIIDSLNYSHVKESPIRLMPFLEELKSSGIACENMFSQAPYTEAAVMNIYCGQDVLQNKGYLFRFKDAPLTIFEAMQEKGYVTYFNSYQPQCHPSSVRRGVDHIFYNVGYDQGALWSYRLGHYAEVYRQNALTEADYQALEEIFEDNLSQWIRFTDDMLSGDPSVSMIRGNAPDYDAAAVKALVSEQYRLYREDPRGYIHQVLTQGTGHCLFKIPAYVQSGKIADRTAIPQIKTLFTPLFQRIRKMSVRLNRKNTKGLWKGPARKFGELVKHPGMNSLKNLAKSMLLSANAIYDLDLFERLDNCDWFKNAPSGRTHIDHYISWAKAHTDTHFACIHIDDIHNPEVFFTYDSDDLALLRQEERSAQELLDQIPESYSGSLTHDLSLRYMDNVIRYLYEQLAESGLLEDTCVLICADHGFSFSGNPLRDSAVVNLYLENYNIPCVITGSGLPERQVTDLRSSKDIPATLCYLADRQVPAAFTGTPVTNEAGYPCVQIEYCGGGCPDISRRELKIAAFDQTYFVGTLGTLQDELHVTEIYDLEADPKQLNNLAGGNYDRNAVDGLCLHIEQRRRNIAATGA